MATVVKKLIDVVTHSEDIVAATGVTPAVVTAGQATRSGELLTPELSNVGEVQSVAAGVTAEPVFIDGVIECLLLAASTNISLIAPFACKIIDAWAYKVGVSADAGDVCAIKNGATDICTFALNVADGLRVAPLATGLDHADNDFAAGDTITGDPTNSTTCACMLFIRVKRTA